MNLSNTKAVGSDGLPLLVYRGEHGMHDHFIQSRMPSITFGSQKAAEHYALNPNVMADVVQIPRVLVARLAIDNPVFNQPHDPLIDWADLVKIIGLAHTYNVFVHFDAHVRNTNAWDRICSKSSRQWTSVQELLDKAPWFAKELCILCYVLLDYTLFVERASWLGFDGAIYQGSGETLTEVEYRVFNPSQILFVKEYHLP